MFFVGFLNANVDRYSKAPANYGLMDIIAALHWIQENIEAFGGDPRAVTLAGYGTGAACVHYLMTSSAVPDGKSRVCVFVCIHENKYNLKVFLCTHYFLRFFFRLNYITIKKYICRFIISSCRSNVWLRFGAWVISW